jgi:hypothetical protein
MANHHFSWEKSLSMVIFHSFLYVYQRVKPSRQPIAPTPLCSEALIKAFAKIVQGVDIVPELIQGGPRQLG